MDFVTKLDAYGKSAGLFRVLRRTPTRFYVDREPVKIVKDGFSSIRPSGRDPYFDERYVIATRDEAHFDTIAKAHAEYRQATADAKARCNDVCRRARERFEEASA